MKRNVDSAVAVDELIGLSRKNGSIGGTICLTLASAAAGIQFYDCWS